MRRSLSLVAFAALVAGCAGTRFPTPMTAAQAVEFDSGEALVTYLRQPDASPAICDLHRRGPRMAAFTPKVREALVDALVDGELDPHVWRRCVRAVLAGPPAAAPASMLADVIRAHVKLLRSDRLQEDPATVARAVAMQRVYLERPPELRGDPTAFAGVQRAFTAGTLAPVARSFARDLLADAEVERGAWAGRPVTAALMDALAAVGSEMTLRRFAERLPTPELRREAIRRAIRVRIELSAFDEVRADAAAVEERMLRDQHNRIDLAAQPFTRVWFDDAKEPSRAVIVRQHVRAQAITLLALTEGRTSLSVLPALSLRGRLWAEVGSLSRPITLCSTKRDFDPSPCIAGGEVSLDNPIAYLDRGKVHFRDSLAGREGLTLAPHDDFRLPIRLAGRPAVSLLWGLHFERPDDLVFTSGGGDGPDLQVYVHRIHPRRTVFDVGGPGSFLAVVEDAYLADFRVGSVGADGVDGSHGIPGSDGASGSDCDDGGDGGDGGDGSDGGHGYNGGNIHIVVDCNTVACEPGELIAGIVSKGGRGGSGGHGGSAGQGGRGGPARDEQAYTDDDGNRVVTDHGCAAGRDGSAGTSGRDGADGVSGRPGVVRVELAEP